MRAAYERDEAFFTEQAVYNKALYHDTPAGRIFRSMVGHRSGKEWQDFSSDQMRRSVFDAWSRRLWNENPSVYPHPDDDLDALNPPKIKREESEAFSDFMVRRAEELKSQNDARLSQVKTWLNDAPNDPKRIYPLIVRMMESIHQDVQECMTRLAETQEARQVPPKGFSLFK